MENIIYRKGKLDDLPELKELFVDTLYAVCSKDYDKLQIKVWAAGVENEERWNKLITEQIVLVAQGVKQIIGFATLANNTHLDMLYIHKNYQHQGIAKNLYTAIEEEARRKNQTLITADVSKTAFQFFERAGFEIISEQIVSLCGIELINFQMKKDLK